MSEPKFTTGKWEAIELATNITLIMPAGADIDEGHTICTVSSDWDVMPAGRMADIRLITAAPDLYAACELAVRVFEMYAKNLDANGDTCRIFPEVATIRQAIAKAKGEDQV